MTNPAFVLAVLLIGVPFLLLTVFYFKFGRALLKARASGLPIKFMDLLVLKLRKIPANVIFDAQIKAADNGVEVTTHELAVHFLAGGNVQMVVDAFITAKAKKLKLSFEQACEFDLKDKGQS
jgi:uncharacterized protein YqfA (UPF0365 family)